MNSLIYVSRPAAGRSSSVHSTPSRRQHWHTTGRQGGQGRGEDNILNYPDFEVTFEKGPLGLGLGYSEDERVQVYTSEGQARTGDVQELDLLAAIRTDSGWVDATSVTAAGDIIKAQSLPVQLRFCRSTLKLT
jgi:hypothetical protein